MTLFRPALLVLGYLLLAFSIVMLVPVLVHPTYPEQHAPFLLSSFITATASIIPLWLGRVASNADITSRQIILVTVSSWLVIPIFGALPLILGAHISIVDGIFESVSGLTTTGSTVMVGLDTTPHAILLWRSMLQWLGGIGIIGMAAAVLPQLRGGGMRLFRSESSDWSEKTFPRARQILALLLWSYIILSIICALAYRAAGMSWFDAINHMMTTLSTGGFSTSDGSMGHFHSRTILWVSTIFMAIGGMPFMLFARILSTLNPVEYKNQGFRHFLSKSNLAVFKDQQVLGLIKLLASVSVVLAVYLVWKDHLTPFNALTQAAFNVTSIVTTTGFASQDYTAWGTFAVVVFFFLTLVGGCSGSTAGGIKIFRFQLCFIFLHDHLTRLIHPHVVISKRYNGVALPEGVINSAVAFLFVFFLTLAITTSILGLLGLDLITSLSAAASALANVGPGLGKIVGPTGNFSSLPATAKLVLAAAMILGRLELLAMIVVFTPGFWKG